MKDDEYCKIIDEDGNEYNIYDTIDINLRLKESLERYDRMQTIDHLPVAGAVKDTITFEDASYVERDPSKVCKSYNPCVDDIKKQRRHYVRLLKNIK